MKKISLILALFLILSSLAILSGCQTKDTTCSTEKELPTFEQLIAINNYDEIFKSHKNIYISNICNNADPSQSTIEKAILMPGDGKVEYHMVAINTETNAVVQNVSRIGNTWCYYDCDEGTFAVLEVGSSIVCEISIPNFFDECKPMGKAYIDGDYVVHHAYSIFNEYEDIEARRYDYTYYFNKETYLLEKVEAVRYDNNHFVLESNVAVFKYDVNDSDVFEGRIYDEMINAENRIDIEIIVDYNTANEKKYSLVATTDTILYAATINDVTYLTYSDSECQNPVTDLSVYEGVKSLTLYATEFIFEDDVRYTVTEEEWDAWTTYKNYTIEQYYGDSSTTNKYTEDALQFENGNIILFIGDKQYSLSETENGYIAHDCTGLEITNAGLLSGGYVYDEFTYDEELGAYVLDLIAEQGMIWEVRFEDGVPVSVIYKEIVDGVEALVVTSNYYNVGTTVVDIPDYVFEEEEEDNTRYTVTEEEWNLNLNAVNYSGMIMNYAEGQTSEYSYKCTENAIEMAGNLMVSEGGKTYLLQSADGTTWYAVELEEGYGVPTMVPQGLNFSDYEYSEYSKMYVPKVGTGEELYYSFGFKEGVLSYVLIQTTIDPENPEYYEFVAFLIDEIGTVVIEIPEYTVIE